MADVLVGGGETSDFPRQRGLKASAVSEGSATGQIPVDVSMIVFSVRSERL